MTLLYTDPLFLKHDTGRHPERPDRLRAITARLDKAGLVEHCTAGTYQPLTEEAVAAGPRRRRWSQRVKQAGRARRRPARRRHRRQPGVVRTSPWPRPGPASPPSMPC